MKNIFLLVMGLALVLISGCDRQEPAQTKSTFEKIQSGELSVDYQEGRAFLKEVCMAIGETPKFDTSTRRAILKDYGFDLASIAKIEANLDQIFLGPNCHHVIQWIVDGSWE